MSLTINDVAGVALVDVDLRAGDARAAVERLATLLEADGRIADRDRYVAAVLAREEETGGTGMESGIAIPHAKSSAVLRPGVAFGRSPAGVDFGAEDGTKADLIFLIAAPEGTDDFHVRLLSRLARRLIHEDFRSALREADTATAVMKVIEEGVEL